jgi:hypothetical protein
MQRYDVFLDQLSETARTNICWNTAERIYGQNKGKMGNTSGVKPPAWEQVLEAARMG